MRLFQLLIVAEALDVTETFRPFYEEYFQYLYNFIHKMIPEEETAQDLTQEAFTRILKNWQRFTDGKDRKSYLFTIAVNLCRDQARSSLRKKQHIPLELVAEMLEDRSTHSRETQRRTELEELEGILKTLIAQLPEEERMILHMKRLEGMSYDEISGITGQPVRTLKRRVRSALDRLIEEMNKMGILAKEVLQ